MKKDNKAPPFGKCACGKKTKAECAKACPMRKRK